MKIDNDIKERIKVSGIFILQFYKIVTGCLLSLFIPQACGSENDIRICSLTENLKNDTLYHRISMCWNFLTLVIFMSMYTVELKRENWAIKYLDIDNNLPDNNLKKIIGGEKILEKQMDSRNLIYFRLLFLSILSYSINILITIKILISDYHSFSTISCFISFVLLVLMKLYNSFIVSYQSSKNDKMLSAYMNEFVSYNILDKDYESIIPNKP